MNKVLNIDTPKGIIRIVRNKEGFNFFTSEDITTARLRREIINNYDDICVHFSGLPKTVQKFFNETLIINNLNFKIMSKTETTNKPKRVTDKSLLESKDIHEKLCGFISMAGKSLKEYPSKDKPTLKDKAIRDKRSRIIKYILKEKPDITDLVKDLKSNQKMYDKVMTARKGDKEVFEFFEKVSARFGTKVSEITLPEKAADFWG